MIEMWEAFAAAQHTARVDEGDYYLAEEMGRVRAELADTYGGCPFSTPRLTIPQLREARAMAENRAGDHDWDAKNYQCTVSRAQARAWWTAERILSDAIEGDYTPTIVAPRLEDSQVVAANEAALRGVDRGLAHRLATEYGLPAANIIALAQEAS